MALTACATRNSPASPNPRDAQVTAVQQQLTGLPGVTAAKAEFFQSLDTDPVVRADLTVGSTASVADAATLGDRTVEIIWRSPVRPLTSIAVVVHRQGGGPYLLTRVEQLGDPAVAADLTKAYGPRTVAG
jgi:hypothetical protein